MSANGERHMEAHLCMLVSVPLGSHDRCEEGYEYAAT